MDEFHDPDPDPGVTWPRTRVPRSSIRVVMPIVGGYHALRHRLDSAAREHGLDAAECLVLEAIRTDLLGAPWNIRRRLGFAPSTLTGILDRLERDERIVRRSPGFTTKQFELGLTPAGRSAAELATHVLLGLEAEIAGYTSPDERQGAVAVFETCMALDRSDRPHP